MEDETERLTNLSVENGAVLPRNSSLTRLYPKGDTLCFCEIRNRCITCTYETKIPWNASC